MRAIVQNAFGGPDTFSLEEIETPEPTSSEILIQVACASVNPVDWKIREGKLKDRLPHRFPIIPGWDAAGVVAKSGSKDLPFQLGDKVWAYCRKPTVQWGTYAEYVGVEAAAVARMPK